MYIEEKFDWNSKLELPQNIKKYCQDNYCVYIEPEKAQWCIIPVGQHDKVFNLLKKNLTFREIYNKLITYYNCSDESATTIISDVLAEVLDKNFVKDFYFNNNNLKYKELKIYLTNACNLKCYHCYRYKAPVDLDELKPIDWDSIIRQHSEMGGEAVLITGGEPLLRKKNLYYILKTSKKYGQKTVLLTNGTLLDYDFIETTKGLLDEIQISLDGPTADIADEIRGAGNFNSVLAAIKSLNALTIRIFIAMTPLPENVNLYKNHLSALISKINSISDNEVMFRLSRNIENGRNVQKMNPKEQFDFENQIFALEDKIYGEGYNHLLDSAFYDVGIKQFTCGIAGSLCIQPNGDIMLCDLGVDSICNVKDMSLREVTKILDNYSKKYSINNVEVCKECTLKYLCGGPCRIEMGESKQYCSDDFKKGIIERLIKMNRYRYEKI